MKLLENIYSKRKEKMSEIFETYEVFYHEQLEKIKSEIEVYLSSNMEKQKLLDSTIQKGISLSKENVT
jgi:hypothetical protein